jgi:putative DNA methylase
MNYDASAAETGWRSRGYLPHVDAPDVIQHVVFRLADSLPPHVRAEYAGKAPIERMQATHCALDRGHGCLALADPRIAAQTENALLRFDGKRYALIAWCVMPNHVHALVEIWSGYRLDRIVHSWKSFTAHAANRLMARAGRFWAPEYFDRYMRDDLQLAAAQSYIEENPVKAGLCAQPQDWPFSSAAYR